jgi:hypothetical protein
MKRIALILITFCLLLLACNNKGDYNYVIRLRDSSTIKAWNIEVKGSMIRVSPALGGSSRSFYINSQDVQRIDSKGCGC